MGFTWVLGVIFPLVSDSEDGQQVPVFEAAASSMVLDMGWLPWVAVKGIGVWVGT